MYAGTAVLVVARFTNTVSTPTDPTTVEMRWQIDTGPKVSWTYAAGQLLRLSPGVYTATMDTTGTTGTYVLEWIGTGSVAIIDTATFSVIADPL